MNLSVLIFLTSLNFSAIAQESTEPKPPTPGQSKSPSKESDNTQEEQQKMEEKNVNDFDVGPYDREGNFLYYSRLQEEEKAAKEDKALGGD